jgi:exonuclease SbcC
VILAVHLENIKSYERGEVEFAPGTNAICGPNGAGKSTLIEAIGFALFGSQRVKQEQLIRSECAHGRIDVSFVSSLDGLRYTVTRELRREGASTARMYSDAHGLVVAQGVREVQAELLQHLGIKAGVRPSTLFEGVVGVPQGQLTSDFLLPPNQRKARFEELLALQEFELAYQRLSRPLAWGRDRLAMTSGKLEALRERIEDSRGVREELVAAQQKLGEARRRAAALTGELEQARLTREALDRDSQALEAAREALTTANAAHQIALQMLAEAQRRQQEAQEAADLAQESKTGHDRYLELEAEARTLEQGRAERDRLREECRTLERRQARLEADALALAQRLDRLARAEDEAKALRPAAAQQAGLEARLAEVRARLALRDDLAARQARLAKEQASIARQIEQLAAREKALSSAPEQLEGAQAQLQEVRAQFAVVSSQGITLAAQLEAQRKAAEAVERGETDTCPACSRPFEEHDSASFLEHLRAQVEREERTLEQMRAEAKRLLGQQTALQKAVDKAQQAVDELRRVEAEGKARREQHAQGQLQYEALSAQLAELAELDEQAAKLAADLEALGDPRARLLAVQELVAEREELLEAQSQAQAQLADAQEAWQRLDEQLAAYADLDALLAAAAASRDAHRDAFDTYRRVSALAAELPRRSQECAAREQELTAARADLDRAQSALQDIEQRYDPQAHQEARARERELEVELARTASEASELERRLAETDRRVRELERLEKQRDDLEQQARRDGAGVQTLAFLRDTIRRTGPEIARLVLARVSQSASVTYSELMGDFASTLAWDEDYGITIRRGAEVKEFAQLSGGEQMVAALAVRLALLREVSDVRVAFFDEPTVNLDEERRRSLAEQIRAIRDLEQLFVISHDDSLESVTEYVVRVRKEDGLSRLERG